MEQPINWEHTRYGGFWIRVLASLIDTVLLSLVIYPALYTIYGSEYFQSQALVQGPVDFLLSWVAPAVAIILFWVYKSATPGKMMLSLRIVDATTGGRPSTTKLIIRYLSYYLSALGLLLGFIWVAFDKRKQGWHDKLAGTVVVRSKAA